jgi:hypothetical protein
VAKTKRWLHWRDMMIRCLVFSTPIVLFRVKTCIWHLLVGSSDRDINVSSPYWSKYLWGQRPWSSLDGTKIEDLWITRLTSLFIEPIVCNVTAFLVPATYLDIDMDTSWSNLGNCIVPYDARWRSLIWPSLSRFGNDTHIFHIALTVWTKRNFG